ncbi:hypothetical protein PPERSA_03098 [Pseudocohnilembus persalinus]|uniref:Uncharacterized protein n=1 Tax=Pseudocohnilembus persalinus TaxID=266149 RepID=A0A0V0QQY4_PSEPJ|nr:hypothetical protein PPERSA_03098 [Pseudocohnilembus persalinus]|eukprot:KRX04707.1 hypothetical protein PPERSA_03098 [Pseudocohnilembus persalinus]
MIQILIIGGGFGGILAGIHLKKLNLKNFKILEKNNDFGGTWLENRYPGSACDVQSHLYSFSFEQNPDWSSLYAKQEEIWSYQKQLVKKYGLKQHFIYDCQVKQAAYKDEECIWVVKCQNYAKNKFIELKANFIISATGVLNNPQFPKIEGIDEFKGKIMHSSQWDKSYDIKDKNVAVIGSGASCIQIVPNISQKVKNLYVFQRSANYVQDKKDYKMPYLLKKFLRKFPSLLRIYRVLVYINLEVDYLFFRFDFFNNLMGYLFVKRPMKKRLLRVFGNNNQDLIQKFIPKFKPGCKRLLLSNNYFEAFQRKNVKLITDQIVKFGKNFIELKQSDVLDDEKNRKQRIDIEVLEEKFFENKQNQKISQKSDQKKEIQNNFIQNIDCVILATGFDTTSLPYECFGKNGKNLNLFWNGTPKAYYGICNYDFPNFFQLFGPNTTVAHNSALIQIETQMKYINMVIQDAFINGVKEVEVQKVAFDDYYENKIKKQSQNFVQSNGNCSSWYLNNKTGELHAIWTGSTIQYSLELRKYDKSKFKYKYF